MRYLFFALSFLSFHLKASSFEQQECNGHVSVELNGQFGNQLFQIAAAYAHSLDNNLALTIPNLVKKTEFNIPFNAEKVFLSRIASYDVASPGFKWTEKDFSYSKIPPLRELEMRGYFQSEKYFKHRRDEILQLFAAPSGLNELILSKYPILSSNSLTVGVQIRDYRAEPNHFPNRYHPTIGRKYYEKAMSKFPEDTMFIVSSNNMKYAKECTEGLRENIIYLQSDYIEEFYTLVLCKSFIISNSTFGWWAAWLSTYSEKSVIAPNPFFSLPFENEPMMKSIVPDSWTLIQYD